MLIVRVIQEEVFFGMAKAIESYETMAIYSLKDGEDGVAALNEKFKDLIEKNATLDSVDEWGKRRLAYEIDDMTEGYYVLYTFTSAPDFPAELDRVFKITEGVMRSLITVSLPKDDYVPPVKRKNN
jgi:small subunit ribosomal protein S6